MTSTISIKGNGAPWCRSAQGSHNASPVFTHWLPVRSFNYGNFITFFQFSEINFRNTGYRFPTSFPRARASLGSQRTSFWRNGHVCREEKKIISRLTPLLGSDTLLPVRTGWFFTVVFTTECNFCRGGRGARSGVHRIYFTLSQVN